MHYIALAVDYDGTIAHNGVVDAPTIAALEQLRAGARRLILVTGRELPDLQEVMPRLDLQITFNKGAVMVLPGGVTKASGLRAARAWPNWWSACWWATSPTSMPPAATGRWPWRRTRPAAWCTTCRIARACC